MQAKRDENRLSGSRPFFSAAFGAEPNSFLSEKLLLRLHCRFGNVEAFSKHI